MTPDQRKAAVAAYKERKTAAGIFAVTCAATGERWIGYAQDLSTIQNRLWFTLRQGGHRRGGLQAAWTAHGPEAFGLEVVETLDEETLGYVRDRVFMERQTHWCAVHQAEAI
ncbi:GIY-YIG nuclease family protein [Bradyrhizobium ontarionense]|uniref:GIY-YIG nuclease family protein n=1 Tax=Bradyrhizobium ontarionense TaxID=2898149 RepID=A0ABY3R9Q6_9BRAD|nr:GIY-YIG nuclease family protein [Bradyrhizobium sp. A19]UFZ03551.1 GIY-YIG nuclease family protein [Bradyrhizobium sp. A19]